MTIEEAIAHCKEISAANCNDCGNEHKQLAEWLTELLELRDKETPRRPKGHGKMKINTEIQFTPDWGRFGKELAEESADKQGAFLDEFATKLWSTHWGLEQIEYMSRTIQKDTDPAAIIWFCKELLSRLEDE